MSNEFLPFATAVGANVQTQAAYTANADREDGNQPGIASSALNNKALRQSTFVASQLAQMMGDKTGADILDDTVEDRFLSQLKASVLAYPPQITSYLSGSGTHYLTYLFFIATGSATASATYTNNAITYTVQTTVASGTVLRATGSGAPTASGTLTKSGGTGDSTITFYAVRAPIYLNVQMVGGGGGGGAVITNVGVAGSNTTFGDMTAGGGGGGGVRAGDGGAGGTVTVGSGVGISIVGGGGAAGANVGLMGSGPGGGTFIGGGAPGKGNSGAGVAGTANTGGGGSGGSDAGGGNGGSGGGGGGLNVILNSPSAAGYSYAVGGGGAGGAAGTQAGGAGGSGKIVVFECYQ